MEKDMTPLIWTCVYGGDDYFNILRISLESLVKYGSYKRSICIFSDRDQQQTLQYVPTEMWAWTIVLPLNDDTPSFKTRWECVKFLPECHEPILHVDTDVVFDATIEPVLHELFKSKKMSFSSERLLYPQLQNRVSELEKMRVQNAEWFGFSLFIGRGDMHIPCINAGIFGAPNKAVLVKASDLIIESINKLDPSYYREFGDQPAVNYSLAINGMIDEPILDRYTHFTTVSPQKNEVRLGMGRRGFCHFLWARGDQKTKSMENYVEILENIL